MQGLSRKKELTRSYCDKVAFMQTFGTASQEASSMSKKHPQRYSLSSFFSYLSGYELRLIFVGMLFLIANILLAVVPVFIGKLVGALATTSHQEQQAMLYVWILIICSSSHDIIWRLAEVAYMKLLNPLAYRYENILFREIISKPYPYFVDKFTGKLASYIGTISQEMREFLETCFYNYISQVINIIAVAFILSTINWQTGAIFATGIMLMFVVGRYTVRNTLRYEKIAADVLSTKNGKIIDAIANFINVKSFHKEQHELDMVVTEQSANIQAANTSFGWAIFFWGTMSFFIRHVIWPATILLNVHLFLRGQVSVEQLTTLLATILLFSTTIWEVIWQLSQFNLKMARVEEAHTYLFGYVPLALEPPRKKLAAAPEFNKSLEMKEVQFAYPDKQDTPVLQRISLSMKAGEKIGIVGKSGSGKTTLTKLLLGYYPVRQGTLRLDGELIDTREIARLISYVPQDTSLFHRSIVDNIAYAANDPVETDDIIAAAKQAHAHEFIVDIPDAYDALVGERGVKLSAGQRQRIAIARAFLDDKPILILDEATSALDSESELLVQKALENLWENKTVIAIAHRLSTLRNMDRILVMEAGRIVEQGSHAELLKHNGVYATLWSHQSGGFIEE
ncbi:ABC transporter ATP-binding protein [Patescibacteria group bacterium]|nr:MAG: ABC transporter ATP-binding protein [Patescibacteria group bacterium]